MNSTVILVLCVAAVVALAAPTQAQSSDVFSWMDRNAKGFKSLVNLLGITRARLPAKTKGTLLVPSDKALNEFVKQMSMSGKEFMSRKQLVDLVVSYHFIPGYQAKSIDDVPGNPTLAVTADFNYVLRFYKGSGRVWVKDVQGNDVPIKQKPIQFGQLSVIPIDRVLMSGGYFFNGLGSGRVWAKDVQGNDVTIKQKLSQFGQLSVIPIDRVLMSGGYFLNGLVSAVDCFHCGGSGRMWTKDVQGYDMTIKQKPIQFGHLSVIPIDRVLMSGGYFFNGLDALKQYPQWSEAFQLAEQAGWPVSSDKSDITMFVPNNGVISAGTKAAWEGLSKAQQKQQLLYHFVKPAMSVPQQLKSGRLPTLLQGHDLKVVVTPAQAKDGVPKVTVTPEVGGPVSVEIFNIFAGRAILQGVNGPLQAKLPGGITTEAAPKANGRRSLLYRGGGRYSGSGYNQATANSIAATNTAAAIDAAASGYVPARAATAYGSYQAEAAASYGNHCYNCYW
ncbi:hypothetical protein OEZ86_013644 [Tetradesmus obliquus]|nr:hypothetical protein OEZ86_013644 [Tetradesmus obliquus]